MRKSSIFNTKKTEDVTTEKVNYSILLLCIGAFVLGLAGCGQEQDGSGQGEAADTVAGSSSEQAVQGDYEVFLEGDVQDTLRGRASYGVVVNSNTGRRSLVIELRTASNLAGGMYVMRGDTTRPDPGEYELTNAADTAEGLGEQFAVIYREGMRRRLSSTGGTLTIDEASDTLLTGSFEAEMTGYVKEDASIAGGEEPEGEDAHTVHAEGTFRADRGSVGYLIGL